MNVEHRLAFRHHKVPIGTPICSSTVTAVNDAESLIRTLIDAALDVCFANPGTTELPIVQALDEVPGMRADWSPSRACARAPLTATRGWRRSPA